MTGINAKLGSGEEQAFFEMSFSPSMEYVSMVRRFVGSFYLRMLSDPDLASRVALGTHELLENAVKYSSDGETHFRMVVTTPATRPVIEIRTRNKPIPKHIASLIRLIDEMNALGNPFTFYQTLMRRSAKSGVAGGLGLGRIAAEAEMKISYEISGEVVEIIACTIPEEAQ